MKYHLIYKTINLLNNKYYIGCHSTNDIDDTYLGSGKALRRAIKKYGRSSFKKEILEFCSSREEMFKKEQQIIIEEIMNDSKSYNCSLGGRGGYKNISENGKKSISKARKNKVVVRLENDKYIAVDKNEFLEKNLHGTTYRRVATKDQAGKNVVVDSDTFYKNNMEGITKGKTTFKDKNGKTYMVSIDDERVKNGEFVGVTTGSKQTLESNLKRSLTLSGYKRGKQKIVECPYCKKKGGISNMKRWHFENCKNRTKN